MELILKVLVSEIFFVFNTFFVKTLRHRSKGKDQ